MGSLRVGSVMGDIAVFRGSFGDAYEAVAAELRTHDILGPDVDLVFDVPGALSAPVRDGIDIRRRRGGAIQAWIAVPLALVASSAPHSGLLALAFAALDAAAKASVPGAGLDRGQAFRAVIDRAASALGLPSPRPDPRVRTRRRDAPTAGAVVEAGWELPSDSLDERHLELMAFEALLEGRLQAAGAGTVDGNEIGEGRFVIFVETDVPSAAIQLITTMADESGLGAPSFAVEADAT